MKFSMNLLFAGAMLASAIFTGCKEDNDNPVNIPDTDNLVLIASGHTDAGSMLVKVWAEGALEAQYTKFFIEVRDSATLELVEDAHVELNPMMDMGMMTHSAPFENPSSTDAVNGLFPCAVVFQMPGAMGWELTVQVHNHHNGGEGEVTFPVSVAAPAVARTHVVTAQDGTDAKYIISYVQPRNPKVGVNDFGLAIHTRASMMSFPPATGLTVTMVPTMPSMGHGSPNNVNPVHTANGHYKGSVNFTMTGTWVIDLTLLNGTDTVYSGASFEVTF